MLVMRRETLLPALLLLAVPAVALLRPAAADAAEPDVRPADAQAAADPAFEEARRMLTAGRVADAKEHAMQALAASPYAVEGYQLMRDIAAAEDDLAGQLRWGKWLYWSYRATGLTKEVDALAEELDALHPDWNLDGIALDAWIDETYNGFKKARGKKQYRLAGHLIAKLMELDPGNDRLRRDYDKLIDQAGNEVSGGAFVAAKVRSKSQAWVARQNAKHESWEDRWERRTEHYDVETNLDYEFFETLCAAMDEVNEFYRLVYDYEKRAPRVRLAVHRKRSDFDRFSQEVIGRPIQSESVGGYWVSTLNTVAAFDRSYGNPDMTRDDLWITLFHEASHQFMSILMAKNERKGIYTPTWLDEGTASYFEGCQIKADGTIVKNNVAERRLRSWWYLENSERKHSLEDLIAHPRNTGPADGTLSYEGEFYPYGWAFVYFLLNYEENDRRVYAPPITPGQGIPAEYKAVRKAGKLVYREPYLKYLEHFAKEGNKENSRTYPLEMAKKFFVDEVGDPDVPNWDAFENRWRKFTTSLYRELEAGWEFADVLQARCRGYLDAGDFERARITAEQADDKRPNDPETYRLLAEANLGADREGDAVYWMFRHWEMAWPTGDEEALAAAEEWLDANGGRDLVSGYIATSKETLASVRTSMENALGGGQPVLATLFATHAMTAFDAEFPELSQSAAEMSEISGQDLRMWQAAFDKGSNGDRKVTMNDGSLVDAVVYQKDGMLMFDPPGYENPGYERCEVGTLTRLKPPFAVRGKVQVDGNAARLLMGMDRSGRPQAEVAFYVDDQGNANVAVSLISVKVDADLGIALPRRTRVNDEFLGNASDMKGPTGGVLFDFEVEFLGDGNGVLRVEGGTEVRLSDKLTDRILDGGFALAVTDDTAVLFTDIEVRPDRAFWPVSPSDDEEDA